MQFFACLLIAFVPLLSLGTSLRRCTCAEEEECTEQSLNETEICASECGEVLLVFGGKQEPMVACFEKLRALAVAEQKCLSEKLRTLCLKEGENGNVEGTTIENYNLTFADPKKPTGGPYMQKAYETLLTFKKFHFCIRRCLTAKAVKCFKQKSCGVDIPKGAPVKAVLEECYSAHPQFFPLQVKACHCLLLKQHITKLFGTCIMVGNPSVSKTFGQQE